MDTALVTGASSGIGAAAAQRLLQQGFRVYGAARRMDRMAPLVARGATALELDVTDRDHAEAAVRRIEKDAGGVDVLVNNAGYGLYGAVEDVPLEAARHQFEVNLFGAAQLTRLVLPGMRHRRRGRIVNVSSMGGRLHPPLGAWYHASKHALQGWSDCLRFEVAPFGIHVAVVEPGFIRTGFGEVLAGPLLARSGRGPYARLARGVASWTRDAYGRPGGTSPPRVVAAAIAHAASAPRPRTRYVVGRMARPLLVLRRLLGDRGFDALLRSQLRRRAAGAPP